jgi:hypothetical protein
MMLVGFGSYIVVSAGIRILLLLDGYPLVSLSSLQGDRFKIYRYIFSIAILGEKSGVY